jgi:glutamate--cysteine ligase
MPGPAPPLTIEQAEDRIRDQCFTPSGTGRVGLEAEWHVFDLADSQRIVPIDTIEGAIAGLGSLPGGSRVTFEPGGQLELSSPPAGGVDAACDALAADHDAVAEALGAHGLVLAAVGFDPIRPPVRQLRRPRYDAMEAFFDGDGPAGRRMMCRTAALQVNVDTGADGVDAERRWRLAHLVGPALSAAFATSPVAEGSPSGWVSTRLATWLAIDPSRTAAVQGDRDAFIAYALDANVMLVRHDDLFTPMPQRLSFLEWIRAGHPFGPATADDLDYHLTTLFPPVRPRRWMELRYLDALPDPWWRVAAAVVTALLDDREAGDDAAGACAPVADRWCEAARHGLADPAIQLASLRSITAARRAFSRVGVSDRIAGACDTFLDRYLARGRTVGDDLLYAWRAGRPLVPTPDYEEDRWT